MHKKPRIALAGITLGVLMAGGLCGLGEETHVVSGDFQSATMQWLWHGEVQSGEYVLTAVNDSQIGPRPD